MWYDVYGIFAGAYDKSVVATTEDERDAAVRAIADEYQREDNVGETDWQVHVTTHYCDRESEDECVCAQYEQSHKPVRESKGWVEL